ncbi:hypothetical protein ABH912_005403 [Pseudomonas sp. BT76 TE3572]|nr:hypothetical protein [Pseudomonas mandelii]
MKTRPSHDNVPPLPEHWVNVQSLQWLHRSLEAYESMADHITTAVYTGELHKTRVDDHALVCAIPAMTLNDCVILLTLNFKSANQGGWNLASVTVDDGKGLILNAIPGLENVTQSESPG